MRRNLLLLSVPILLSLGIVTATSAVADTVSGGPLTNGTAVTAKIAVPDQEIEYTFTGTAGAHQTLDVTASGWGSGTAQLAVRNPSNEAELYCPLDSGTSYCEFTPNVTGTWTVVVQPLEDAKGSVTFKLVADQAKGLLAPGTPSTATIAVRGQRAGYTFAATKDKTTTIDVAASNWGVGGASLRIYQPDGVFGLDCDIDAAPTTCELTPPVSGIWRAVVTPRDDSLGSATVMLTADPNQGTLTPGTAVTKAISTRATTASWTLAATAGVRNLLDVSATNWGTGSADLNIYQPNGVHAVVCPLAKAAVVCDWTPPVTGTWKVELAPVDNAVGSVTMTLATDLNKGTLVAGTETTTTIATHGQHAFYTFAAASGDKKVIEVLTTNWGTAGGADLFIYQPDGVLGVICPMTTVRMSCPFNPKATGTWKVAIFPHNDGVGTATMLLVADLNKGTITPGTAVTAALPTKGSTASYTFAATSGVRNVLDVSTTNWGTGSAELKIYLPNGDLGLSCPIKTTASLCYFIPKVTGTWKVVVDPVDDSVGSVTMTLGADQNKGTLTPGTAVTTAFASRGWQASYTFAATAKLHTTIDVGASTWTSGRADLFVYQPNGTLAVICPLDGALKFCDFIPPVTGTWKVAVMPSSTGLGSVQMTLAMDQNKGTLAAGASGTTTIALKGQRAFYSFTATANAQRTISVTSTNWGTGTANLNLYQPDGKRVVICPINKTALSCKFIPKVTGTWKVEIAPIDNALGSAAFTLN